MSGDADSGTSTFICESSTVEILSTSSVYSSAPMFFITNTDAAINLEDCTFTYGSGVFLNAGGTSEWGTTGSNGGVVTLTLKNQNIEGNFVVDGYSGLTINMESSSITGTINSANTAAELSVTLDSDSKITLTGNSYYTSLTNAKTDGSNLVNGTYSWTKSEEKEISRASGNSGGQSGSPDGSPGERPDGSPGERTDGSSGERTDGSSGERTDGSSGEKSDGSSGEKSDGSSGEKSDGSSDSSSDNNSSESNILKYSIILFVPILLFMFILFLY